MSQSTREIAEHVRHLERQIAMLRGGVPETEREAMTKAQYRADSVSAMFGTKASAPALGESAIAASGSRPPFSNTART